MVKNVNKVVNTLKFRLRCACFLLYEFFPTRLLKIKPEVNKLCNDASNTIAFGNIQITSTTQHIHSPDMREYTQHIPVITKTNWKDLTLFLSVVCFVNAPHGGGGVQTFDDLKFSVIYIRMLYNTFTLRSVGRKIGT